MTSKWMQSLVREVDEAEKMFVARMYRDLFPVYFGPNTYEQDARTTVHLLLSATGAYGALEEDDERCECCGQTL